MAKTTRRQFLKHTGVGAAGAALALSGAARRAAGANERITVGLIGCGGRGSGLGRSFRGQKDVHLAYVCDPDRSRLRQAAKALGADHGVTDLRKILDDKAVDAVIIATPDHWHAPAAVLACRAGKHVYVEKPCSHNIREGRLMVRAAREHKRVVQVGTQARSSETIRQAVQMLRDGAIGEVLVAKAVNSQRRADIGRGKPSDPPAHLDYDAWLGPAPFVPYQANRLHYRWHWWYAFGTGDIGNDGVHELDVARWGLGVDDRHPAAVRGHAAKMFFDDDQQFPDTYYLTYDYPAAAGKKSARGRLLIYEQRIWSPYRQEGHENGNMFYGAAGMLVLGKGSGWQLFGKRNKLIKQGRGGAGTDPHVRSFLDAIKGGKTPSADIEIGHRSAALAHLGNIVARVGRGVKFDPAAERVLEDAAADKLTARTYRKGHWAALD
jgi:predicted dehydrogenase